MIPGIQEEDLVMAVWVTEWDMAWATAWATEWATEWATMIPFTPAFILLSAIMEVPGITHGTADIMDMAVTPGMVMTGVTGITITEMIKTIIMDHAVPCGQMESAVNVQAEC
jgi:hypothetical protein